MLALGSWPTGRKKGDWHPLGKRQFQEGTIGIALRVMMSKDTSERHLSWEKQSALFGKALGILGTGGDSTRLENVETCRLGTPGSHWYRCLSTRNHATNVHCDGIV